MSFLKNFPGIPAQIAIILAFVIAHFIKKALSRHNKKFTKQKEYRLRPIISLFRDEASGRLYPKNIGLGPAFSIYFDPIEARSHIYVLPKYDFLGQGDYARDFEVLKTRNDSSGETIPEKIDLFEIRDEFTLKISYSDIEKARFESVLRISKTNHTIELITSGRSTDIEAGPGDPGPEKPNKKALSSPQFSCRGSD